MVAGVGGQLRPEPAGDAALRLEENTRRAHWNFAPNFRAWRKSIGGALSRLRAAWFGSAILCATLMAFGPAAGRIFVRWRHTRKMRTGRVSQADATVLYERMLKVVKRQGSQKPPWFTAAEFAATLPASATASAVAEFTKAYQALRFGGERESAEQMGLLLRRLEKL